MSAHLALPSRLDLPAAVPLAQTILQRRGSALSLDAGNVTQLGGLCLQVLLAAAATWRADSTVLTLSAHSEAFMHGLAMFGFTPDAIQSEIAA